MGSTPTVTYMNSVGESRGRSGWPTSTMRTVSWTMAQPTARAVTTRRLVPCGVARKRGAVACAGGCAAAAHARGWPGRAGGILSEIVRLATASRLPRAARRTANQHSPGLHGRRVAGSRAASAGCRRGWVARGAGMGRRRAGAPPAHVLVQVCCVDVIAPHPPILRAAWKPGLHAACRRHATRRLQARRHIRARCSPGRHRYHSTGGGNDRSEKSTHKHQTVPIVAARCI